MKEFWMSIGTITVLATLIVSLHLATSARIDRLQAEYSAIRTEVRDLGRELRADVTQLRGEVYELRGELKGRDLIARGDGRT